MKRLLAFIAASAAFFMPTVAFAGGSDSPTPYTVTGEGIVFPAPLAAHGHVNVRTDQGSFGLHFDPNNGHPGAAWIGEVFLPWSALGISEGCVVWVQVSDYNEHFGEGGQAPVCLTPEPELSPEPEPSEEPSEEPTNEPEPSESETPTAPDLDGEETSTPTPEDDPGTGGAPSPSPDPTPTESVHTDQPEPTRPAIPDDPAEPGVPQEPVEEPRVEIGTPHVIEQPEPSPTVEVASSSVDSPELAATGINPALTILTAALITIGILLIQKGLKK